MSKNVNYINDLESYDKAIIEEYKKIFSGSIKESFLANILRKTEKDQRFNLLFLNNNDLAKMASAKSLALGKGYNPLNICKMIVMSHYTNTVLMSDNERGLSQESLAYSNELIDDVLKMFSIEKIATFDFGLSSLESYLPIIYYVAALNNFLGGKYDQLKTNNVIINEPYNAAFNYTMIYKLIIKIKACINLADLRATDELMVIYRSLTELFMVFAALWDEKDDVINSYIAFNRLSFDNNYGKTISDSVKLEAKKNNSSMIDYINYGWIKNLKGYSNLKDRKRAFSISALAEILDEKYDYACSKFGTSLYKVYKICNPQTHGTMQYMNYFQLELDLFENIAVMLKYMCEIMSTKLFNFEIMYNGIDLIEELNIVLKESRKISDELMNNEKILNKTNIDYKNRAICCIRMKTD
ncbi:MAG: hypothetical protein IJK27_03320 [Bacilli bacterium]|nr:hypothetical protein [Bacilli bacterium]